MTQHEGINPHTASDLLRQAMLNRSEDDTHDHLLSQSATPTGIRTPRPDPSDKRLPGIMHAFFGQVRAGSSTRPESPCPPSNDKLKEGDEGDEEEKMPGGRPAITTSGALPTAPNSPEPAAQAGTAAHRPSASGKLGRSALEDASSCVKETGLLTPPVSSASSFTQKEAESDKNPDSKERPVDGAAETPRLMQRRNSPIVALPLRSRRHTVGLKSLSGIVTDSSVAHAACLSNPVRESDGAAATGSSTTPNSPIASMRAASVHDPTPKKNALSLAASYLGLSKLTESAGHAPRRKSTPPHTPRALSSSGVDTPTRSPLPSAVATPQSSTDGSDAVTAPPTSQPPPAKLGSAEPNLRPPKGKLFVRISEARGLKPSYDPYCLCVFEYNEYITKGPRNDGEDDAPAAGSGDHRPSQDFLGGVQIQRTGSDSGRTIAIPMKSRQNSAASFSDQRPPRSRTEITDPKWEHELTFDVVGENPGMDLYVYDRSNQDQETFLGLVRTSPNVSEDDTKIEDWFKLQPRNASEKVTGEIYLELRFEKTDKTKFGPNDFQILKLIGKGTFGQVYQVRKKDTGRIYAMKVLSKKVIVQKKEVAHTLGERNILVRTAMADSPFIVGLKFSFQTPTDLYLVTDFMCGGELFWHLQKEGRFNETRAKFYIAELILALQHLHQHEIVYRDLKPENILLDANGHIALCDFGLSKANLQKDDTTNTFCGTTEYLAPEVLLDEQGYTTMVDFWSLGVLVFEMCCGWSPFYAEDTQQMYKNIAFGKVRFPRDALSTEGRNFVKGLLNRNPKHRLGAHGDAEELKAHPFFADVDWDAFLQKRVVPPFKPKLRSVLDTSNFDPEFTNALTNSSSLNARAAMLASGAVPASTPLSPGVQAKFEGFTYVNESNMDRHFKNDSAQDPDRMDEEPRPTSNDDDWDAGSRRREDRMSGIIKTSTNEDGIFNESQFEY